jgi:hypothetical protein
MHPEQEWARPRLADVVFQPRKRFRGHVAGVGFALAEDPLPANEYLLPLVEVLGQSAQSVLQRPVAHEGRGRVAVLRKNLGE